MTGRALVAGIGNIFLADDGFGSQVARVLLGRPLPDGVRVVDYGIRGMHLAFDLLEGYDLLVIVDAVPHRGSPGTVHVLAVGPDDLGTSQLDAHGMEPTAVLASLGSLGGELPRTFVVGCEPEVLEEGIGLSPVVEGAVEVAARTVVSLVQRELASLGAGTSASSEATGKGT